MTARQTSSTREKTEMKRLVIFDLDGTLLDTVADLASATNHALRECGFPVHDGAAYYNFVGRGINMLFRNALPESERTDENIARDYGTVQIPFEVFDGIDRGRIAGFRKETFGYACITNDKRYFEENHPELKVKSANIDDFILLLGGGSDE